MWPSGKRLRSADLAGGAYLRERISKVRRQTLILHADNGNVLRPTSLESRLKELGVLRSFSRPRVSNDNPTRRLCSAQVPSGLSQTALPQPGRALRLRVRLVGRDNHQDRQSAIRFVTPDQLHRGLAIAICRHRGLATSRPVSVTPAAGAASPRAGISRKRSGSNHRPNPMVAALLSSLVTNFQWTVVAEGLGAPDSLRCQGAMACSGRGQRARRPSGTRVCSSPPTHPSFSTGLPFPALPQNPVAMGD